MKKIVIFLVLCILFLNACKVAAQKSSTSTQFYLEKTEIIKT